MALRADDVDLRRDRDLVVRAQAGDEGAFEELYRRYFNRLVRFCRRQVFDAGAAEELSQEAFTRAYRNLGSLAGEKRFYPWLTVIARRLCIDHLRRIARVEPSPDVDAGVAEPADGPVLARESVSLLDSALARVKPRHREVIMLREFDELSYRDISDRMAAPVSTVETLLFRARQALRRELEGVGAGPWVGLPVIAALRRLWFRLKSASGVRQELIAAASFPVTALAAAAMVAVAPAAEPLSPAPTPAVAQTPGGEVGDAGEVGGGAPTGPETPTPGAPGAEASDPSSGEADPIEAGPIRIELGPEGSQRAREEAEQMPLFEDVGPAFVGANAPEPVPDALPEEIDETADDMVNPLLPVGP